MDPITIATWLLDCMYMASDTDKSVHWNIVWNINHYIMGLALCYTSERKLLKQGRSKRRYYILAIMMFWFFHIFNELRHWNDTWIQFTSSSKTFINAQELSNLMLVFMLSLAMVLLYEQIMNKKK